MLVHEASTVDFIHQLSMRLDGSWNSLSCDHTPRGAASSKHSFLRASDCPRYECWSTKHPQWTSYTSCRCYWTEVGLLCLAIILLVGRHLPNILSSVHLTVLVMNVGPRSIHSGLHTPAVDAIGRKLECSVLRSYSSWGGIFQTFFPPCI